MDLEKFDISGGKVEIWKCFVNGGLRICLPTVITELLFFKSGKNYSMGLLPNSL